jgi:membrane-associated protease RseP (regulator of RpoE activity)
MLGATETPYDLRFRLLGIPVRVHPLFWLVSAVLGWQENNLPMVALWVACVFVSILVHEYGHGLMAKAFHASPSIVLWGMGGLCETHSNRQTPLQRLAVLLSGPGAGFVLCLLVMVFASAIFGITPREHLSVTETLVGIRPQVDDYFAARMKFRPETHNFEIYRSLVWINLMWGLVNLLPIWPLDGGRVSEIVLSAINRAQGVRWGHIVSLLVAGILAVLAASFRSSSLFLPIFFGYFAFINYQMLQSIHQAQAMGLYQDDEWWKR